MSDETTVERRLATAVATRQSVEVNHNLWPTDATYAAAVQHTKDLDCGREAIRVVRSLLTLDELNFGDVSVLQEDDPTHPVVQAYVLLAKCREDGRAGQLNGHAGHALDRAADSDGGPDGGLE